MKYFSRSIVVLLFLFFSLFDINGQEEKQEVDTIDNSTKRIDLLIKEKVLKERSSLEISEDDVRRKLDSTHSFGILKDNYFITGNPLNKQFNVENADVKYQISFRQRLSSSYLPFNTFFSFPIHKSHFGVSIKNHPLFEIQILILELVLDAI